MLEAHVLLYAAVLVALSPYLLRDSAAHKTTDPSEVNALSAVRSRLIDPTNSLKTWNSGDPCSSNWRGVFCYNTTNDGYLHIQKLQLLKLNLSGSLAPELGLLSHLKILDFMWNNLTGSIPKEIGNITSLHLLLLNGNQLSGFLPEEIGNLSNLNRLQIDENQISGPIPKSFANLRSVKHLHMNNNSLSGQIPPELSVLPVFHLLVDNNNLSGNLPLEFSEMPNLKILQLDNNNFSGTSIPTSYGNISSLLKLSLRNCSLQGSVPDLSRVPQLGYLDLSRNQLNGPIPTNKLSTNITTIILSHNSLNGTIPANFSGLPNLQILSLDNNRLDGSVPSTIWNDMTFVGNKSLTLDFQNNSLANIPNAFNPPANVTVLLYGNPVCTNAQESIIQFCQPQNVEQASESPTNSTRSCPSCPTDRDYERNPNSPMPCSCAVPLGVGFRLKSPGISDFRPYIEAFEIDLTSLLHLFLYQLYIEQYMWESGPRLNMHLKLFPSNTSLFNETEVIRLQGVLAAWEITLSDVFGPYELLYFTLGSYGSSASGLSKGALVGILMGAIAGAIILSATVTVLIVRRNWKYRTISKRSSLSKFSIKIDGVKRFTFEEMATATNNFSDSTQVGQGGYGKVYKDRTLVAIKRAEEGSLQGSKEFCTEIELLSRLHHRNLVSLVGYCDDSDEQMLVYEFLPNGSLRDHLSAKAAEPLNFAMRLHIALGSAKGILYLHTEADPPIFHRDIKASNILLDSKFVAKVADFGLSRLAPVPDVEGVLPGYVSTVVKGTPGYLDPEYFLTHKLTDKSDVYSLGVVFLELLTGMKPIVHGKNIVREVTMACQSGKMFEIIDSNMSFYPSECVEKFLSLALKCCREETDSRPSMSEVVRELESIWRMVPDANVYPSEYSEISSNKMSKSSSTSLMIENPFTSSDPSGSDHVDNNIPSATHGADEENNM
ncbi:putative LRR receptor-like serine/threonine-protein kinase [Ananas comosus]|uniref:non-specific serine/threonine protein kinase n=1 Tax=Ananas comosus TaxID=4615 RepID=A0A199UR84_ANACO|nr:putative LRR receptor-like serine/threonine-protein kinase [Ananas comosus]